MEVQKTIPNISIPEFYNGKSVFVTGGMGFVGKVLVEKLLRSCPGIENIYMLCRSKQGKSINERLVEITSSPAFDDVRKINPDCFKKIILIEGDVAMLELGISKTDQEILKEKVSIVIHSAATINFAEHLQLATFTNLRSVREALYLAREMKNLKSFVHVSTAFTFWHTFDVKEDIGETEHDPQDIIKLCEMLPPRAIEEMTKILLGKHVNTYTFTKSLAEKLLQNESKSLPVTIVRPSMIGASENEPKPGWTDSWGASTLFLYLIAKGSFRSVQHVKGNPFDVIPVDKVANMTIAASWKTAIEKEANPATVCPQVYHSTSGAANPITLKDLFDRTAVLGREHPLNDVMWYPKMRYYTTKLGNDLDIYFLHYLPAVLLDVVAKLTGKKPRAVKGQKFVDNSYQTVRFGPADPYIFRCSNYKNILSSMNQSDQKTFVFDPRTINWNKYAVDHHFGIKKYLLKETPKDPAVLRAKVAKLKYVKYFVTASLATVSLLTFGTIAKSVAGSGKQKTETQV
ncbi:putative fatty acyl-CoA reductase CG5065 [Chironomus tepperi]|uniref:putative fatty acyl-CoA reductase CG5065 n=1 Tax=Chironomus tepperi TaxID=113505 RepID=UPI00391F44C0